MSTTISKGRHVLGKLSRNCDKTSPRNCEAALTWELRDDGEGRLAFSASGEVWNHLKTDVIMCGQCVDDLAKLFPKDVLAQRICQTWTRYHLNDMRAGTPEQCAYVDTLPDDVQRDFKKTCDALAAVGLLDVPITSKLSAAVKGDLPTYHYNQDTRKYQNLSYRYGSRWVYSEIPADIIAMIKNGFRIDNEPALPADPEEQGEPDRDLIAEAGLSINAEFVPWSKSRGRHNSDPSLNWRATLLCNGCEVGASFDYSAGSAHCPAYKRDWKTSAEKRAAIRAECENGKQVTCFFFDLHNSPKFGKAITLEPRDVIHSYLSDCQAINARNFSDWCSEYGYSDDSIAARKIYDQCIAQATALRAAVGSTMFDTLMGANQ